MSIGSRSFILGLNEALSAPALAEFDEPQTHASDPAQLAAYELAVAVGRCRLFVSDNDAANDYVLTEPVAEAASRPFCDDLRDWIAQAKQLGEDFDEAASFEDVDLCADTLLCRMTGWAVFTALDESFQEALECTDSLDTRRATWMNEVLELFDELDESLQTSENLHLLSTVASLPLLDNLRAMLTEPHKEPLPWWLDGRLEEIAEGVV